MTIIEYRDPDGVVSFWTEDGWDDDIWLAEVFSECEARLFAAILESLYDGTVTTLFVPGLLHGAEA